MLISSGAYINHPSPQTGKTALMVALEHEKQDIINIVFKYNVDIIIHVCRCYEL